MNKKFPWKIDSTEAPRAYSERTLFMQICFQNERSIFDSLREALSGMLAPCKILSFGQMQAAIKALCLMMAFAISVSCLCPIRAEAKVYQPDLSIEAKSAILIEPVTGKILFEQNPDERLPLASVTKIMTTLLIYEALEQERISWDDIVSVSDHAASMGGSQIFLESGEQQSVTDLTKSIVVASANDAAVAMAEFVAGSEESFVSMMNKKAGDLGMKNSSFKNACGLDSDGHFSSARDVAIMSRELIMKHPKVLEYAKIWQDTIIHKTARGEEEFGLTNTNKLIKWYNGATGLKTGSTGQALYCLSGTAERDGMQLIAVVLGAPTPPVRFQSVMTMLDYGYANFKIAEGEPIGTSMGTVKVKKGVINEIEVVVKDVVGTIIPKSNTEALTNEVIIDEYISAPVLKGTKAGEIIYRYNGEEIGRSDLVTVEDVKTASYFDILDKLKKQWF